LVQVGDVVVELDASNLLEEENAQKILVATRQSQVSQAENAHRAAEIAKLEYLDGLYVAQESALASALFVAARTRETAEVALESAKALHLEGIFTALQVHAAYASLENATNTFDAADNALNTLRNLTKQKELALLTANIASAEANVQAQRRSLRLEQERLEFIQDQIANCTIRATAPGQVVYANDTSNYRPSSQSQFVVAPGAQVRQRQTIIWLPNPHDMQVKAAVNEAYITTIRPGMPVTIRVAALPDTLMEGEVTKVSQYAEPSSSSTGNIKQYTTIVRIKNPPAELRVGMNADVHIHVERREGALQVPVQALAESNGRFFSLVREADRYATREVSIGSTNDQVATIEMGLEIGDEVVLNPRSTGSLLELPSFDSPVTAAHISADGPLDQHGLLRATAKDQQPPPANSNSTTAPGPETDGRRNGSKQVSPGEQTAGGG
jgi:HlyD family secretion protein